MARVGLPDFEKDGFGAVILPPNLTAVSQSAALVYFKDKSDPLLSRFIALCNRSASGKTLEIIAKKQFPNGYGLIIQPGTVPDRSIWERMGVPGHRFHDPRFFKDTDNRIQMAEALNKACRNIGMSQEAIMPRMIGRNAFGGEVHQSILGRSFVRTVRDANGQIRDVWHGEYQRSKGEQKRNISPASFLRFDTPQQFSDCARGAATMVLRGDRLDGQALISFYGDVMHSAPNLTSTPGYRIIDFQEEIEGHLAAMSAAETARIPQIDARARAVAINSAMPAHDRRTGERILLQQYSTPFPIARSGFEVLCPQTGDSLLEPTIGNGTLASPFIHRDINITGIELDPERAQRGARAIGQKVIEGDFTQQKIGDEFDLVLANPPFEILDEPQRLTDKSGISFSLRRLDHLIAFKALQSMKDNGRAFFVLPADMMKPTQLDSTRRYFDNFLRSAYHVVGTAVVEGRLYSKMGASFPVILYAVGPRRKKPLSSEALQAEVISELPLIVSFDELYAWADKTRQAMLELTGLPDTEPAFTNRPAPDVRSAPSEPSVAPAGATGAAAIVSPREAAAPPMTSAPEKPSLAVGTEPVKRGRGRPRKNPIPAIPEPEATPEPSEVLIASPEVPAVNDDFDDQPTSLEEFSTVITDDLDDDQFVQPYEPFSTSGERSTQIQKSMQGPTYRALLDVQSKFGEIDDFVSERTGLTKGEMAERLSPEQIDALALALARHSEGKGFLVADLMGVGKGRTLAAMTRSAYEKDNPVIFMTEQSSLFSDFVGRDLCDVYGENLKALQTKEIVQPFIFNSDANAAIRSIEDGQDSGKIIFRQAKPQEARANGIPDSCNMVMSTYSQFSLPGPASWKYSAIIDWFERQVEAGKRPLIILDECHSAAGEESTRGDFIERLIDTVSERGDVVYSSATPLKSGRNIRIYKPILPDTGMSVHELTGLIETNPLALQEVLSSEMARMGTIICREIDQRTAKRVFVRLKDIDPVRHAEISATVDHMAEFLREIVGKSAEIDAIGKEMAARYGVNSSAGAEQKASVQTTSPVSQFHTLSQYLIAAVNSAYLPDLLRDAIANGKKPIVVIENTCSQVLSRFANREGAVGIHDGKASTIIDRLPNIGDVLIENASKLLDYKITGPTGDQVVGRMQQFEPWLETFSEEVRSVDFSMLTLSPIEMVRRYCEENDPDLVIEELTRRSLRAERTEDGEYAVTSRDLGSKHKVVANFNRGSTDILVINRSAASGISLHASPKTGPDMRPRQMIKLQLQSEITQERQIDGRIHRYGQRFPGEYVIPMSGFVAQDRLCQLFNRKNRSLTAASNATRENRQTIEDVADLLNPVGERVVKRYLTENEQIATMLSISAGTEESSSSFGGDVVRKLLGRIVLLPISMQETVMSELDTMFKMEVEALDALGVNPLKLNQFDWRADVTTIATLQAGDEAAERSSQRPVNLVKLTYYEPQEPLRLEKVRELIERSREALVDDLMARYVSPVEAVGDLMTAPNSSVPNFSSPIFDKALNRLDRDRALNIEGIEGKNAEDIWRLEIQKVSEKQSGTTKRVIRNGNHALFLSKNIGFLQPGTMLEVRTELIPEVVSSLPFAAKLSEYLNKDNRQFELLPAIVTSVKFNRNDPLNLTQWKVSLAFPGQREPTAISLSSLYAVCAGPVNEKAVSPLLDCNFKAFQSPEAFCKFMLTEAFSEGHGAFFSDAHLEQVRSLMEKKGENQWNRHNAIAAECRDIELSISGENNYNGIIMGKGQNETLAALYEYQFDEAPHGKIARHKYALDGNMFMAVKISQGAEKLGEKAIYTTSNGEIRHGVVLKNENIEKLKIKLTQQIENVSAQVPYKHPAVLAAFLTVANRIMSPEFLRDYGYPSTGKLPEGVGKRSFRRAEFVKSVSLLLSGGIPVSEMDDYVNRNAERIFIRLVKETANSRGLPSLFIGSDLVEAADTEFFKRNTKEYQVRNGNGGTFLDTRDYTDYKLIGTALSGMNKRDLCLLFTNEGMTSVFPVEAEYLDKIRSLPKEVGQFSGPDGSKPDILQVAERYLFPNSKIGRLTKKTVAYTEFYPDAATLEAYADALVKIADADQSPVMARGALARVVTAISSEIRLAQEHIAGQTLEKQQSHGKLMEATL